MRDLVAHAAPQAPARNPRHDSSASLETYNSHRKVSRPKLGEKKVYRPVRRHTLSRIDEAPQALALQPRPRSRSLHQSADFSSTRPMLRSRSNISADTSRSVPVCNQSLELGTQLESSPHYAEPRFESSSDSSFGHQASMMDLPIVVPMDPATGAYIPRPEYSYYHDNYRWKSKGKKQSKTNNLFLAFMY